MMPVKRAAQLTVPTSKLPAMLIGDPWQTATEPQRQAALVRQALIERALDLVSRGASQNHAAQLTMTRINAGRLTLAEQSALAMLGSELSTSTIKRWIRDYLTKGRTGLLPAHTGRVRQDYGWEAQAIELYNLPSKPGYAGVAKQLQVAGHVSATYTRVKAYLKSLPATLGPNSPARVGQHLHKLRHRTYQPRSTDSLLVGEIYAGDGHTCDCYVAHPVTGGVYRAELTAWIDVKSRYIAGWYVSDHESAMTTLFALINAVGGHDHVPGWLYIDRGPGWRARALSDESIGFYKRLGTKVIAALPRNPHGKGWIERWFRTVRDDHDKFFAGGTSYCGDDMAPEINRRLSAEVKSGKRTLPSLAEYIDSVARFIDIYNNRPMQVLDGRCPAEVWAELQPQALKISIDSAMRMAKTATVSREMVTIDKRRYFHEALALYNGHKVRVEYSLNDDSLVWIADNKGRLICEARLVGTIGVLPNSRLEEGRERQRLEKVKRHQRHIDEINARARDTITIDTQLAALDSMTPEPLTLPSRPTLKLIDFEE